MDPLRKRLAEDRKIVEEVLAGYLTLFACPCDWPQFIYWVGKEHGPGWQDGIQNDLVSAALNLPFFISAPPEEPSYGLEAYVTCDRCGAAWKYYSIEWRMLAFQKRLIRSDINNPGFDEFPDQLISERVFATVGHEPHPDIPRLSIAAWVKFMGG